MKKILVLVAFIILVLSILYYLEYEDYYESGENDSFEIKVGQEFHIRLYENGSTGYSNCWINEKNNPLFKKVKEEYSQSLNARLGYIGSGGLIEMTFKGLKVGVDTIKIANCSFRDGEKCTDYNTENTKSDNEFIIKITD
jgi:predicted secreted protein